MGSNYNFTTNISEQTNLSYVKEAYQSANEVKCIPQTLIHNGRYTALDYVEDVQSYLSQQSSYNTDCGIGLNLLLAGDKCRNGCRPHLLPIKHGHNEPCFQPVPRHVHHLGESHVCGVCGSIKSTTLSDASEDFSIPSIEPLLHVNVEEDWGHEVSGLVLDYD